jgi:hypothetical protein
MIVGRAHLSGLSFLSVEALEAYEQAVRAAEAVSGPEGLEAEHGGMHEDRGGACIAHTHVNFIPGLPSVLDMFAGQLPVLKDVDEVMDVRRMGEPYILLRQRGRLRLYSAAGVPSQFIRRRVCQLLDRDDWDWALSPNLAVVRQTLALWRQRAPSD